MCVVVWLIHLSFALCDCSITERWAVVYHLQRTLLFLAVATYLPAVDSILAAFVGEYDPLVLTSFGYDSHRPFAADNVPCP